MGFFKNIFKGELIDECSICLQSIYKKELKKLNCNHNLHKECYKKMMESELEKKCPLCRCPFEKPQPEPVEDIYDSCSCGICGGMLILDEARCDVVKSNECRCFFHYGCIKSKRLESQYYQCNCGRRINMEDVDMMSYLYFLDGYKNIVGDIGECKFSGCNMEGNPKRWGYCQYHNPDITTNNAFAKSLQMMVRYVNMGDREVIFYGILLELNRRNVSVRDSAERLKILLGM